MKKLKHIGQSIRFVRLARNLTMDELAIKVGITSSYVYRMEEGDRTPSWSMLQKLSDGLGVPITLLTMLLERGHPFVLPILPLAFMELAKEGFGDENS